MVEVVLFISMFPVELWLALAAFFGSTLTIIVYFRTSGAKLETRVNKIIKEKKPIVSNSYLKLIEKIIEGFKTKRLLTDEHEEKLEDIAYVRVQLNNVPQNLSKVVDKLTHSVGDGFACVFLLIVFNYILASGLETDLYLWMMMIVGALLCIFVYRYVTGGLFALNTLRRFEKLVNAIERSNRFDELYDLL